MFEFDQDWVIKFRVLAIELPKKYCIWLCLRYSKYIHKSISTKSRTNVYVYKNSDDLKFDQRVQSKVPLDYKEKNARFDFVYALAHIHPSFKLGHSVYIYKESDEF